ncbi:amino acid ABC transporter ATP-binding protein [uncultured Treponema sp.]|uniref:amino acid ABC transporter ATP-binding protein n=2 Tax=Treponema TaxID=157 RepID=UPI00260967C5|nr:amino acid ABC transporter ATP-binding protein [uncultured Treponema sp.]
MAIISVKNIKKSFSDGVQVLKDISFDVEQGEILGIIGPSGSGKSTMLRCIAQLENVDDGSIYISGSPIVENGKYAPKDELRKAALNLGFVFQNFNLFPHMSVLQNITDAQIHVLKTPKAEAVEIARKLLSDVGLSDKENAYPCELSGGQQQRVSIARSLALKPKVLLFDEPTSALDPELTGEILAVIKQLALEKMTMIVVTHEMSFARDISDKIIFMAGGVIVEQGDPKSLISNPQTDRLRDFLKRFNHRETVAEGEKTCETSF